MKYEQKIDNLISFLYDNIIPQDGTVKVPLIQNYPLACSPQTDKLIEEYSNNNKMDISDCFFLPKEKTTSGLDQLAVHTQYVKLNIILAHYQDALTWQTVDTIKENKENFKEMPK